MIHSQIPTRALQYGAVGREDADRHRDERERDRERLKWAEGSLEFWFVAAIPALFVGGSGTHNVLCRHPESWPSSKG
jgi:hypothetical protein